MRLKNIFCGKIPVSRRVYKVPKREHVLNRLLKRSLASFCQSLSKDATVLLMGGDWKGVHSLTGSFRSLILATATTA